MKAVSVSLVLLLLVAVLSFSLGAPPAAVTAASAVKPSDKNDTVSATTKGKIRYTITIQSSGLGTTSPAPGTYSYSSGTTVSITALPANGYQFYQWSGYISGTANPVSFTVNSNMTIQANFIERGVTPGLCEFYYGDNSVSQIQRIIDAKPEFVVLNTPGGSYGITGNITYPTPDVIKQLKDAGIKVLSYIATGFMVEFKYDEPDAPPNTKDFVLGCVDNITKEGCDGVFFDEATVGYWRVNGEHTDADWPAPSTIILRDSKGNWYNSDVPNTWAGLTMRYYTDYAHSKGVLAVAGVDATNYNLNMYEAFDYVLSDEGYTTRGPQGSEIGYENQCWVIAGGVKSASKAASYTNTALDKGFRAAYHCSSYGSMATWFESYISQLSSTISRTYTVNTSVAYSDLQEHFGTPPVTGLSCKTEPPSEIEVIAGDEVTITANPATGSGYIFSHWIGDISSTANPVTFTPTKNMSITAIFTNGG
jgi:hypothetical protein